jgi:hypothetical protein
MSGKERCDEILRLIDAVLGEDPPEALRRRGTGERTREGLSEGRR